MTTEADHPSDAVREQIEHGVEAFDAGQGSTLAEAQEEQSQEDSRMAYIDPMAYPEGSGIREHLLASERFVRLVRDNSSRIPKDEPLTNPHDGRAFNVTLSAGGKIVKIVETGVGNSESCFVAEQFLGLVPVATHTSYDAAGNEVMTRNEVADREAEVLFRRLTGLPPMEEVKSPQPAA